MKEDLPTDVRWVSIFEANGKLHAVGYKGTDSVQVYSLGTRKLCSIYNPLKMNFIFSIDGQIYLCKIGEKDPSSIKVFVFDIDGKPIGEKIFTSKWSASSYFASESHKVFVVSIGLSEFMSGKTSGKMPVAIYQENDGNPVLRFEYTQGLPPLRIALPVVQSLKDFFFVASEDTYDITVYSKEGKRKFSFTNKNFSPLPYLFDEIQSLPPMRQSTIQPGVTCPPIIKKIGLLSNLVVVTRHPRPLSTNLPIDFFSWQGKFVRTEELEFCVKSELVDATELEPNKYGLLVKSAESGKYSLLMYDLWTE